MNECQSSPARRLRVLYIDTGIGLAGGQIALVELLGKIDRDLVEVAVCCPKGSALISKCLEIGIDCHYLPVASIHRKYPVSGLFGKLADGVRAVYSIAYLAHLIHKLKIDIVHGNTFKGALIGGLAAKLVSRPLVFHDRVTIDHGLLEAIVRKLATRIVASSPAVLAKYPAGSKPMVKVISSGADVDHFGHVKPGFDSRTVGYLGRISYEKGLDLLVEAIPLVIKTIPEARFLVGGIPFTDQDATYFRSIKRRIHQLGIQDRVEFAGFVEDVPGFFSKCAVLALPSRREALSKAMLEAMAAGLPVVAFRIGGNASLISDWKTGVMVEPFRIDVYAETMVALLRDPGRARMMGENARKAIESNYSTAHTARQMIGIYEEVVKNQARGSSR